MLRAEHFTKYSEKYEKEIGIDHVSKSLVSNGVEIYERNTIKSAKMYVIPKLSSRGKRT